MAETAQTGERLLVVDDDRLVLATLVSGLKSAGFDVVEADNGDDAILLARANPPDLALLDIRMQGKSGLDVARYLKANTDIPFMFLSAFNDAATVKEAAGYGALGYLVKPLDIRQVIPAIRAALARAVEMRGLRASAAGRSGGSVEEAASQRLLWLATGILVERHCLLPEVAVERLKREAIARNVDIVVLAGEVVAASTTLNSALR
jgi:two-component system, response regulator PdtaR